MNAFSYSPRDSTVTARHTQIISWVRVCVPLVITALVSAALFVIVWMLSSRGITVTLHVIT